MRAFLLSLLIILCPPVLAAEITGHFDHGVAVTLTDAPCASAIVLPMVKPEHRSSLHAGRLLYQGRDIPMCWIVTPDGTQVVIIDEDRDITPVGIENFVAPAAQPSL